METFFTSVHQVEFLARARRPLLLSRHRFSGEDGRSPRRTLPRSRVWWGLDSGGFNVLRKHGRYLVSARGYAEEACRYAEEVGSLAWCATMDWVCEPFVRERTRKSVRWHQMKTVESLLELRSLAPGLPWMPVIQGWELRDYLECVALYLRNGIDLRAEPVVGVGSVCSRQGMQEAALIVHALARLDLKCHVFGYKRSGLPDVLHSCVSADSAAWSRHARNNGILLEGCDHRHRDDGGPLERDVYADARCGGAHGPDRHGAACVPSRRRGEPHHRAGDPADCRNCLRYAEAWSDELVEMARRDAHPDQVARFWGLRQPTAAEVAAWAARDPAEGDLGWERAAELRGDFEVATAFTAGLAGVEVGPEIESHFVRAPGHPCPPRNPQGPADLGPITDPTVRDLPAKGAAPERFRPWAPTFRLAGGGQASLLPPGRGPITPHVAWLLAQGIAREIVDRAAWEEAFWSGPADLWRAAVDGIDARLDRDPFVLDLRARAVHEARTDGERGRVFAAIRDGVLDGVWAMALAERPTWGMATRPDRPPPAAEARRVREGAPTTPEDVAFSREYGERTAREVRGVGRRGLVASLRELGAVQALSSVGWPGSRRRAEVIAAWRAGLRAGGVALSDAQLRLLLGDT